MLRDKYLMFIFCLAISGGRMYCHLRLIKKRISRRIEKIIEEDKLERKDIAVVKEIQEIQKREIVLLVTKCLSVNLRLS